MQHLDEGTIHAWLDRALSPDEGAAVEQHVQQCAECASLVAEARGMIAGAARIVGALDVAPGGVIPKQRGAAPARSMWRSLHLTPFRAALAASLMIAAASLAVIRRSDRFVSSSSRPMESMVAAPAAAPAPLPRVTADSSAAPKAAPVMKTTTSKKPAEPRAIDLSRARVDSATVPPAVVTTSAAAPKAEAPRPSAQAAAIPPSVRADSIAFRGVPSAGGGRGARGGAVSDERRSAEGMRTMTDSISSAARVKAVVGGVTGRAMNANQLLMTSNDATNFVGCYEVPRDSGVAIGALPQRFALDREVTTNPPRNVVFAIDSFNRRDSNVIGMWRDLDRSSVMVTLTSGAQRDSIRLSPATRGASQMQFASSSVRILRTACPR